MADLAKIISELVSAMRKKGGAEPVKELILKAEPTGSSVLRGSEKFDIPHVFQDIGEFERARGMLGAAFPDQIISPSHRLGDAASPMFPQGAGNNNINKLIAAELPDFSPEEVATVARDLGDYMRKTGNSDVNSALMNMLDDPDYTPGFDYPTRQEEVNRLYDVTPTQPAKNPGAVNRAYWPDLSKEERAKVNQFGREKKFQRTKLGRKLPR